MERSPHVLLMGRGADAFAAAEGLETASIRLLLRRAPLAGAGKAARPRGQADPATGPPAPTSDERHAALAHDEGKRGTVGVVARDARGQCRGRHLDRAASPASRWGRVGDSPLIGAGTYASDRSCAVSGTGEGEYFIRLAVARADLPRSSS